MLRSLYSGISGLKTHQTKMDVIGNNIANVNTYGFKASRASFKDIFYQTMTNSSDPTEKLGGGNASQIGYGSTIASIDVLHTRSGYAPTGRGMDVAIEGEGFLIAQDANGDTMYTRVGQLYFDADGYLVDSNRNYICGYPIKTAGGNNIEFTKNTPVAGAASKGGIDIATDGAINVNGDRFNDWNFKIESVAAGTAASIDISGKTITIKAASQADVPALLQAAQDHIDGTTVLPSTDPNFAAFEKLKKGVPGGADISKITVGLTPADPTAQPPVLAGTWPAVGDSVVLTITGGVSAETGKPQLDVANGAQRIKKPNTLVDSDDNGYYDTTGAGIADLKSIAVGSDGTITGTTPEGKVIPIGQICLASVPNAEALVLQGSSYYKAMNNTGEIEVEAAGAGQGGKLVSSNLEQSNVDLSNEFADMITTQRGFQANSRIITVGDQMLEELVNMKR